MEFRAKARRLHAEHGLALIVIDYLRAQRTTRPRACLFRYVLRPAIAHNKLAFDGTRVTFTLKRTLSDGRGLLHFSPRAFIRRIAHLVPRPRQHEIVYWGLFASNAKDREKVVRVATHRKRSKKHPVDDVTARREALKMTAAIRAAAWP